MQHLSRCDLTLHFGSVPLAALDAAVLYGGEAHHDVEDSYR
jgi:hypothetical protein